jgi:hypothetical protein
MQTPTVPSFRIPAVDGGQSFDHWGACNASTWTARRNSMDVFERS